MKKLGLGIIAISIAFSITSCNKDEDNTLKGENIVIADPVTAEDHKENLEQSGITLAQSMNEMQNQDAVHVAEFLFKQMNNNSTVSKSPFMELTKVYLEASNGKVGQAEVIRTLKSQAEEPETWQQMWDNLTGEYSFNSTNDQLDTISTVGNEVLIRFPGTQEAYDNNTNNAHVLINSFSTYNGPFASDYDSIVADLPSDGILNGIYAEVKMDGNVLVSYTMDLSFDANGYFNVVEVTYTVGTFSYTVMLDNDEKTRIAASASLKNNGEILIEAKASAEGDWSETNVENNTYTETSDYGWWEYEYDEFYNVIDSTYYQDEWTNFDAHNVVTGVNASFQILNIKLVGEVDVQGLGNAYETFDSQYNNVEWTDEVDLAYTTEEGEIIREYVLLQCVYAENGKLMAAIEPYPYQRTDEWWSYDYTWNEQTGNYDMDSTLYTDTYYSLEPFLVFDDGTKVHPEVYFRENFDGFWNELNAMLNEISNDLELEDPIDGVNPDEWN